MTRILSPAYGGERMSRSTRQQSWRVTLIRGSRKYASNWLLGRAAMASRKRFTRYERHRASLLHLIDLKRAGYSPTMTEMNIATEDSHRRMVSRVQIFSGCGSSI